MDSGDVLQGVPDAKISCSRSGFDLLVIYQRDAQRVRHLLLCPVHGHSRLFQVSSHGCLHGICLGGMAGRAGFEPARERAVKTVASSPRSDLESAAIDRSATAPWFSARAAPIADRATEEILLFSFRRGFAPAPEAWVFSIGFRTACTSLARATCRSYPGGPPLPLRVSSGSLGVFHRLPACPADSGPVFGKDREPLTQGPLQRLSLRWFPAMAPMPKGKSMGAMRLGL